MADLLALQDSLGIAFNDPSLLEQALVHRSYLNENPEFPLPSNERLEFLGDSLLGFVIAEELYRRFPDLSEGEMTRLRSMLVRMETLARLANSLELGAHLYLGLGEEASGGRERQSNLARTMEAVVGAVLMDRGFDVAKEFVLRTFEGEMIAAIGNRLTADYKSRLQEVVQAKHHVTPTYRTTREEGPDHDREFTVEVMVGRRVVGRGQGKSKRMAEMEAARIALEEFFMEE